MYFAHMYKWGRSNDGVGITGIVGCMGVVYAGHNGLYAIHIPDMGRVLDFEAARQFSLFVRNNEVGLGGKYGRLYGFVNSTARNVAHPTMATAEEVIAEVKRQINNPSSKVYRVGKGQGSKNYSAGKSIVILVRRVHSSLTNPSGCDFFYKLDKNITWKKHLYPDSGAYNRRKPEQETEVPNNLVADWTRMSILNTRIGSV